MPYQISFDNLPNGYAANSANKGEEKVTIIPTEFVSSEDGDLFISRLDGLPTEIITKLPKDAGITCSNVDHLLAIINRDLTATIYVNELEFIVRAQIKRSMEKGEFVYSDDIANIERVRINDVIIPNDAGICFIFSRGWRKALFYDLLPLMPEPHRRNREIDFEMLLGQFYAYLFFQDIFKISEEEWKLLIEQQWFPFISLKTSTIKNMINHVRAGWCLDDDLLGEIATEIIESKDNILNKWKHLDLFKKHSPLLVNAFERYVERDFISATSILYPRIEGIMRTNYFKNNKKKPSQHKLIQSTTRNDDLKYFKFSMLLPDKFSRYLDEVYFANFDPKNTDTNILSRHSLAHGVASSDDFSLKAATLGILIIEQLSFFMKNKINA